MTNSNRFKWETRGKSIPENIVKGSCYRFTLLTERLIRIEYDKNGVFEDSASQTVFYRDFPRVEYTVVKNSDILKIETKFLSLEYKIDCEFLPENLKITLKKSPFTVWHYGEKSQQLYGTASTLDTINGSVELEDGVCSRNGYTVMDDSKTMLLSENGWFENRKADQKDLYFWGYGHAYKDCIKDFYRLTGIPPLLPDYALGNWWSRYYRYTQEEYCSLIERFERENIPFSVAVVDMDWHVTQIPNATENWQFESGWTGYSWNKELFPNYKEFLKFLHSHNLKTALNLHPAQGIGAHEDMYEEMAKACGVNPETKKRIKLDLLNPDFMEKYFDVLHHPYEEDGVNFWWMDWQQGSDYWWIHDDEHPHNELETMSPLWLLNHLHIIDISRNGKRPMFFSRYSGLGSHRYPVGFSGDTIVTWESLDFQPYFTATASNVGYGWWSHDIGGHMCGYRDDELQIRWLQLGVFSPINRLHSAINPFTGKEPWNLGSNEEKIAGDLFRLRHKLFPYIYTMNYRNHTELEPLVQPMYYSHPEFDEAYEVKNQYWFGSEIIVAPITQKGDTVTGLSRVKTWLPEGKWIDAFNGFVYDGSRKLDVHRSLDQMAIFAKSGAIIPMQENSSDNKLGGNKDMSVLVFAGADNEFSLYEDDGDGSEYKNGKFAVTAMSLEWLDTTATFNIFSVKGDNTIVPKMRNWILKFRGFNKNFSVKVYVNGKECIFEHFYDVKTNTIQLKLDDISTTDNITVELSSEKSLLTDNSNTKDRIFDILLHSQMSYNSKTAIWNYLNSGHKMYNACSEQEYKTLLGAIDEMLDITI